MNQALGVAWYRFRATFGRRWGGYLGVVLLIGLVGGVAMGAVAGARRTQASFPTYLASTNPSDLNLPTALYTPGSANDTGSDPTVTRRIDRLPHVRHVETEYQFSALPLGSNGFPGSRTTNNASIIDSINEYASIDGELSNQDRGTPIEGRLPDPKTLDEAVVSPIVAQAFGLHVGDVLPIGFYTNAQTLLPGYGTDLHFRVKPHLRIDMKVVGIVVLNNAVVVDDVQAASRPAIVYTPVLARRLAQCCVSSTSSFLRLDGGAREVPAVEAEIGRAEPKVFTSFFQVTSNTDIAERAIKPESLALGVFGGIAGLAVLLIAGQIIGRQLRLSAHEAETLRALGAGTSMTMIDALIGVLGAIIGGSVLAVLVAVGLSPFAPFGVVRVVYPDLGVTFDRTVLGLGFAVLVLALSAVAVALAYSQAPQRVALRRLRARRTESGVAHAAFGSGLPVPAVEGIRFALDPGAGRSAVPVRSTILGAMLALIVLVSTVTFGTSLDTLISHPALYGWNWNYELSGGGGIGTIPQQRAARLLDHDPVVAAWSSVYFGSVQMDGQVVPVLGQNVHPAVSPRLLSGHGLDATNQVVLGPTTLSALHKRVGETVSVRTGVTRPTDLLIVGTATMPTTGISGASQHPTMGTGALLSDELIPPSLSNPFELTPPGPSAIFVTLRRGTNPAASLRSLNKIAATLTLPTNFGVAVLSVQHPAEIINYRSTGTFPVLLAIALATGAVTALGLTLLASVRRRRRDLALLKTFGFTRRQLAATVAWQSSVSVGIGAIFGVPLGIVFGRLLWDLFAHEISAVPVPSIPGLSIVLIAIGSLVIANVVAAVPGRIAARTPTALLLRAE
jgi:hypothetical protein